MSNPSAASLSVVTAFMIPPKGPPLCASTRTEIRWNFWPLESWDLYCSRMLLLKMSALGTERKSSSNNEERLMGLSGRTYLIYG
jgi:hypothetical protein